MAKSTEKGIFRFTSILEPSDNKLWGCHFRVPKKTADVLISAESRRVRCTLNGTQSYQCAILFYRTGLPVISVNTKVRKALHADLGDEVSVELQKDGSEYGLPVPEELKEVMRQDPQGKDLFHGLTPGKQRTLIYIVGNVKDPEMKIARALVILQHLKECRGSIVYKTLNSALKELAAPRRLPRTTRRISP